MASYELDPWGEHRADWRAAMVASTMANLWAGGSKSYKLKDFLPRFEAPKPQDWRQVQAAFKALAQRDHGRK